MLTRKSIELSGQQRKLAMCALVGGFYGEETVLKCHHILLYHLRCPSGVVHLTLERLDLSAIAFEGCTDFILEVVDDDKVWEEGKNVFNLKRRCAFKESHGTRARGCIDSKFKLSVNIEDEYEGYRQLTF